MQLIFKKAEKHDFFFQTKMILNGLLGNDLIDHVAENIEIQKISTFAQTKNPLIYMSMSESSNGKYNVNYNPNI